MKKKKKTIIITVVEALIAVMSISSYSLWTDEGIRLHAVVFGNLKEVIRYGLADKQLFFVLKQYIWTSLVGTSEVATRSLNLLFVWMIIYYLNKILRKRNIDPSYGLLLFISPMFVYYMNDAGPYIILLAYSLAFLYYVFFTNSFNSKRTVFMINLIFLLGVGTHFIFGFVYLMYLVKVVYVAYKKQLQFKPHFVTGLFFSPFYLTLLVVYMQAIESGASRGWEPPTVLNILFVIYSFIGSAGLSLSRNEIRAEHFSDLQLYQICLPGLLVVLMGILLWMAIKNKALILKPHALMLSGTLIYGVVFYLFSYKWHFHFWDRHFIMAYAVFIILLIEVISQLSKKRMIKVMVALVSILFMFSSLQLRFNSYYGKDNYKATIDYLLESEKSVILYQGDWKVSNYYGIEALDVEDYQNEKSDKDVKGLYYVIDIRNKTAGEIKEIVSNYDQNQLIIVFNEKYDSKQAIKEFEKQKFLQQHTYNTFTIFEKNR
ncbi:hypothetical protein [Carnobacterium maltaromaticum]|uniref:hypothetical protein n=1 Tax=Carnobacterium maltaromaticum TaxID=2751 RepID=UPI00191BAA79|nr:hypothetical protein [Carnobacterium maltaromaticum]CAD5899715.1 membrane hypothetical protein [Carnobacterium maltaromaticum]